MYYLRAIYDDGTTRLGTFANRCFRGSDINKVIQNFKKQWFGVCDRGEIIGVQVECCLRTLDDPIKTKKIFFNVGSENFNDV
jgi:hypothetical protein